MSAPQDNDFIETLSKIDFTVIVRLDIRDISPRMWPAENRSGTMLLERLLALAIKRSGVCVFHSSSSFDLNRACFVFTTDSWKFNLRELLAELERFHLKAFATVAAYDPREMVLRLLHSSTNEPFPFPDANEFRVEQELVKFETHRLSAHRVGFVGRLITALRRLFRLFRF